MPVPVTYDILEDVSGAARLGPRCHFDAVRFCVPSSSREPRAFCPWLSRPSRAPLALCPRLSRPSRARMAFCPRLSRPRFGLCAAETGLSGGRGGDFRWRGRLPAVATASFRHEVAFRRWGRRRSSGTELSGGVAGDSPPRGASWVSIGASSRHSRHSSQRWERRLLAGRGRSPRPFVGFAHEPAGCRRSQRRGMRGRGRRLGSLRGSR
jgi:hypothetical protein